MKIRGDNHLMWTLYQKIFKSEGKKVKKTDKKHNIKKDEKK